MYVLNALAWTLRNGWDGKFYVVYFFFYHNKAFLTLKFGNTQCWIVHWEIGTYPHPINSRWDFQWVYFLWMVVWNYPPQWKAEEGGVGEGGYQGGGPWGLQEGSEYNRTLGGAESASRLLPRLCLVRTICSQHQETGKTAPCQSRAQWTLRVVRASTQCLSPGPQVKVSFLWFTGHLGNTAFYLGPEILPSPLFTTHIRQRWLNSKIKKKQSKTKPLTF